MYPGKARNILCFPFVILRGAEEIAKILIYSDGGMKMIKKIVLMVLTLLPISSVAFAAQSALTVAQAESGDTVQAPPSVSWTNGN